MTGDAAGDGGGLDVNLLTERRGGGDNDSKDTGRSHDFQNRGDDAEGDLNDVSDEEKEDRP